jgi:hypothetical protein
MPPSPSRRKRRYFPEIRVFGSTPEIASDLARRGQHIGGLVALGLSLIVVFGCKQREPAEQTAPSASPSEVASAPSLPEEVYEDESAEPARSATATDAARLRRHAPAATKRRPEPASAARLFDDYGFPVLAAVEHLCGRRDYPPGGGELTWDAFACESPPAELVERYKKRIGESGFQARGQGAIWTVPAGAPNPRTLEVLALDAQGKHRSCTAKPGPGAKSVIVISRR